MMSKAVSVDKSDILLITDLEVGMRTVARNIINKIEWVPCKIIAKYGAFRQGLKWFDEKEANASCGQNLGQKLKVWSTIEILVKN